MGARVKATGVAGAARSHAPPAAATRLLLLVVSGLAASAAPDARAAAGPTLSPQASFAGAGDAFFGYSVAIDGDTAVVGAINDDAGKGAAYVFVRSGGSWSQQAVLTASDGAANDEFGYAVAVSGDSALVGAAVKTVGSAAGEGAVYSFTRSGSQWSEQQTLTSPDGAAGDCFGCSLALSGGQALIGAPGRLGGMGAAYVFASGGAGWASQAEFVGLAGESLGFAVALAADTATALVGAYGADTETGRAYVFTNGAGGWSQQAVLTAADGQAHDRFGYAVAVSANTALVGAYDAGGGQGAVYAFARSGASWAAPQKITASDGAPNDFFGYSVALSGGTAVVGAYEKSGPLGPGAAYVLTTSGAGWSQQKLLASGPGQYFGYAVATTATTALVGGFGASNDSGAASVFAPAPAVPALGGRLGLAGLLLVLAGAGVTAAGRPSRSARAGRPS